MKKVVVISFLSMVMLLSSFSPVFSQGEATALFLLINPGARQGGMGEAGVALANDASAVYWNPAGLAFQYNDPEVDNLGEATLMHVQWLPQFNLSDLYYDFAAARYYLPDIGTVGLAIQFINYGENIQTNDKGDPIGRFNSNEVAVTASYAVKANSNLGVGVNLKYIYSNLSPGIFVDNERREGRGTSFAVDLGVLYYPSFAPKLSLGLNISNIGPKMTYIDKKQADPLPTNLRVGLAYKILDSQYNRFTLVYDVNRLLVRRYKDGTSDNVLKAMFYSTWTEGDVSTQFKKFTHSIGFEYWYTDLIALRWGSFYEDPSNGGRKFWTFGGGVRYSFIGVDFSYIYASIEDHPLSDTMRFSLTIRF
ncbi:MAG: UPF0164 family protein [Calditrichaeota bacterium]|nr:UPF0164 family protein [Calditrichota bacterium]